MWDAVRKIFSHDAAPEDAPRPGDQAVAAPADVPTGAGSDTHAPQEVTAPAAVATSAPDAVEVSPPGHAPQGLAAEPEAQHTAATPPPAEESASPAGGAAASTPAASTPAETQAPEQTAPALEAAEAAAGVSAGPTSAEGPPSADTAPAEAAAEHAEPRGPASTPAAHDAAASTTEPEPTAPAVAPPQAPDLPVAVAPPQAPDLPMETAAGTEAAAPPEPAGVAGPVAEIAAPATRTAGAAPLLTPLEPGTVVGDRYTIVGVTEGADAAGDTVTYRASDARSFERCWSCGSTENASSTRFCRNCGAPIQDHPVTLVETRAPAGEPEEIEHDGHFFHVQPERRRFGAEGVGIEIGAYSAEGPHHPNEDSYWYVTQTLCANSERLSAAIVVFADGMGGYAPGSGLISARIAATVGQEIFGALEAQDGAADQRDSEGAAAIEAIVRKAIGVANAMVLDEIAQAGEMGATLVVVLVHGDVAYVANVGDSRAYYVDPRGRATAITRDQSLVAQEVQQGHLAESDIYTAVGNNIILHAIGEEGVEDAADWYAQPLEPASYLLVCSDGYWKTLHGAVVPDGGQGAAPRAAGRTLSEEARGMVEEALTQGSDDNTTVVLIAIS